MRIGYCYVSLMCNIFPVFKLEDETWGRESNIRIVGLEKEVALETCEFMWKTIHMSLFVLFFIPIHRKEKLQMMK